MSVTPNSQSAESVPELRQSPRPQKTWHKTLLHVCLALFTLEVGLFLVVFPWTLNWNINYFQEVIPGLKDLWYEPSFRGALTGLGLVNLYIACLQIVRSFRKA